jgi:phytase-like protein
MNRTTAVAVCAGAIAALSLVTAPGAAAQGDKLPDSLRCAPAAAAVSFSDSLNKLVRNGAELGGLSSLAYDARSHAWASAVDNNASDPARIWFFRDLNDPTVVRDPLVLKMPDGTPYNGTNSDNEGLAVLPDGDYVVSSETEPAIRREPVPLGRAVPRQVQRAPRRRVTQDHPLDPGGAGEAEVPQGLDERPLGLDAVVQGRFRQRHGPRQRALPQALQDRPRLAAPVAGVRAHLDPIGHPTVQFGLDERPDIDTVHDDVDQFTVDLDVDQLDVTQPAALDQGVADLRPGDPDAVHGGVAEGHPLEAGPGDVLSMGLGHDRDCRTGS